MTKKDNVLRGKLLDLLRTVYPDGIDQKTLKSALYAYHNIDDIVASLEYLTDAAYCVMKEQPHPFLVHEIIRWYKLTPKGLNLIDGNIDPDPGILIQRG